MTEEKIIERIRKCLELSKCADEGEAAAAMLAARRLMEKYGVTDTAVRIAGIGESRLKSTARRHPALWEGLLATVVAQAFGCRFFFHRHLLGHGDRVFIGEKTSAEIASYAFAVLFRKVKAARREHIRGLKLSKKSVKVRRGDVFCYAWVRAVEKKVEVFAAASNSQAAIETYVSEKYQVSEVQSKNRIGGSICSGDAQSYRMGAMAAEDVALRHGVANAGRQGLIA